MLGCEPECEDCVECDTNLSPLQAEVIAAAKNGEVIVLDGISDVEFNGAVGVLQVREVRSALATCPALGLPSPQYEWFCMHDDANGRVIARDETPDENSFQIYDEYPSEEYPSPMTSRVFFSQDIYPKHWGGPWQSMRGIVTAWGAGWDTAREARCNSPVFGSSCNQE